MWNCLIQKCFLFLFFWNSLITSSILGFNNPFTGLIWTLIVSKHPLQSSFHIHLHRALQNIFYESHRHSIWVCINSRAPSKWPCSQCLHTAWEGILEFQWQPFPILEFPSRIKHFTVLSQNVSSWNSDHRIYHWEGHQEMIWAR